MVLEFSYCVAQLPNSCKNVFAPDCYKNALILDQFASEFFYKTHDPCFAVAYFRLEPLPLEF